MVGMFVDLVKCIYVHNDYVFLPFLFFLTVYKMNLILLSSKMASQVKKDDVFGYSHYIHLRWYVLIFCFVLLLK